MSHEQLKLNMRRCTLTIKYHEPLLIIMYFNHVLNNALNALIIHIINLNTIFYTYVEDSTAKTIYIRHYMETCTHTHTLLKHKAIINFKAGLKISINLKEVW